MDDAVILPDEARCELIMLSVWYRTRHDPTGFNLRDEKILGSTTGAVGGLVRSEADLLSPGEALRGPAFVLTAPVDPSRYAEDCLLRDEVDGSKPSLGQVRGLAILTKQPDPDQPGTDKDVFVTKGPTAELARLEEELSYLGRHHPEWKAKIVPIQGRMCWTAEEAGRVAELTYRFQRVLVKFAEKGWVYLKPPMFSSNEGYHHNRAMYDNAIGEDQLPWTAKVSPEGLEESERRIADHPVYSKGPRSMLAAASTDTRAAIVAESPWAAVKYMEEGGA